jgi:hypothetical protein
MLLPYFSSQVSTCKHIYFRRSEIDLHRHIGNCKLLQFYALNLPVKII